MPAAPCLKLCVLAAAAALLLALGGAMPAHAQTEPLEGSCSPERLPSTGQDVTRPDATCAEGLFPVFDEPVVPVQQPNIFKRPIPDLSFGSGYFSAVANQHSALAMGERSDEQAYVFLASPQTDRVDVYRADNLAPAGSFGQAGPGKLREPAGIAYYRGEVYVLDRGPVGDGTDRVVVYAADGTYARQFPIVNPADLMRPTGLDVAWGEVWVSVEVCGGYLGGSWIFDRAVGAPRGFVATTAHFPGGDPKFLCEASEDLTAWWDVAISPETQGIYAGYRMINRGPLLSALSTADPEIGCVSNCSRWNWMEGQEAVWGMRWFMTVHGRTSDDRRMQVTEYAIEPQPLTGQPTLYERRQWWPEEAGLTTDVAYHNREVRIDWWGPPSGLERAGEPRRKPDWLAQRHCLEYRVSDADIFVVGDKGQRWYELARNFESVTVRVDGEPLPASANLTVAEAQTTGGYGPAQPWDPTDPITIAAGELCFDTQAFQSRTHLLELESEVGGRRVGPVQNPELQLDNDYPRGTVSGVPPYTRRTITVSGDITEPQDEAGPRDWTLEVQRQASGSPAEGWRAPHLECDRQPAAPDGQHSCAWNTNSGAFPDGTYKVRSLMRDLVEGEPDERPNGGPNSGPSTNTLQTDVDNTDPTTAISGAPSGWTQQDPVTVTVSAADNFTGVDTIRYERNGSAVTLSGPGPHSRSVAGEGTHHLTAAATDRAGNTDQSPDADTVRIDHTPPTTTATGVPAGEWSTQPVVVTLTAEDGSDRSGVAQIHHRINGGAEQTTSASSTQVSFDQDGTYDLRYWAHDNAGNVEGERQVTVRVDQTAPSLSEPAPALGSDFAEHIENNQADILFRQGDDTSGIDRTTLEYNDAPDGSASGAWHPIPGQWDAGSAVVSWDTSGVSDGLTRVRASTADRAGNRRVSEWQTIVTAKRRKRLCPKVDPKDSDDRRCYAGTRNGNRSFGYGVGAQARLQAPNEIPTGSGFSGLHIGVEYLGWVEGGLINNNCSNYNDEADSWFAYGWALAISELRVPCFFRVPRGEKRKVQVIIGSDKRARLFIARHATGAPSLRSIERERKSWWIGEQGINLPAEGEVMRWGRYMGGRVWELEYKTVSTGEWRPPAVIRRLDEGAGYHSHYRGASSVHADDGDPNYFCVHGGARGKQKNASCTPP